MSGRSPPQQKRPFQEAIKEFSDFYAKKIITSQQTFDSEYLKEVPEVITGEHHLIKDPKTEVVFKLRAKDYMCNFFGSIHGGYMASLIDHLTSVVGVAYYGDYSYQSVSVQLKLDYVKSIRAGQDFYVHCQLNKQGKTLLFTTCTIFNQDFEICYTGSHTKYRLPTSPKL